MTSRSIYLEKGGEASAPEHDVIHEEKKRQEAAAAAKNLKALYDDVSAGKVPPNDSLAAAIDRLEVILRNEETKNPRLNDKGRQVTVDMRSLLESAKRILLEKNRDDKIQNFLLHSAIAAKEMSAQFGGPSEGTVASEASEKARDDMKKTLFHGRRLFLMLARSPEFRNAVTMFVDVARKLLVSQEFRASLSGSLQLNRQAITEPAESEEEYEYEEDTEEDITEEPPEVLSAVQQAYSIYPQEIVIGTPVEMAGASRRPPQTQSSAVTSAPALIQGFEKAVDEGTRQQLQSDIFKVLEQMSSTEDHRNAMESLFSLLRLLSSSVWQTGSSRYEKLQLTPNSEKAFQDGKDVIEHFIGVGRLDPLVQHMRAVAELFRNDEEVFYTLSKVQHYLQTALRDPALLKQVWFRNKGKKYLSRVYSIGTRYSNQSDLVFVMNETRSILDTIRSDEALSGFAAALNQLTNDMTVVDSSGKRHFDPSTIDQIKSIAIPLIIEQLHYIPIPPQSSVGPIYDWSVEDVVLSSYDILPEHVVIDTLTHTDLKPLSENQHIQVDTLVGGRHALNRVQETQKHHKYGIFKDKRGARWPPQERVAPAATSPPESAEARAGSVAAISPDAHTRTTGQLVIRAYNVQFNLKNVKFSFKRKKFPQISDSGLADISTKGRTGSSIVIRFDLGSGVTSEKFVTGGAVSVKIAPLGIRFHNNKHTVILPTLGKVFSRMIRKRAEQMVVDRMRMVLAKLANSLNDSVRRTPNAASKLRELISGGAFNLKTAVANAASEVMGPAAQKLAPQ